VSGASNLLVQFSAADIKRTGSLRLLLTVRDGKNQGGGNDERCLGDAANDALAWYPGRERPAFRSRINSNPSNNS